MFERLLRFLRSKPGEKLEPREKTHTGVYGAVAIAKAFKGADFPLSKQDIMQKYGNKEIEYRMGKREKVGNVLRCIPNETFNSTVELERAFHEVLEENKE